MSISRRVAPSAPRQLPRVLERAAGGAEAGHGHRQHARARQLQQVERAHAHEQRQGRVEAAREAERDLRAGRCARAGAPGRPSGWRRSPGSARRASPGRAARTARDRSRAPAGAAWAAGSPRGRRGGSGRSSVVGRVGERGQAHALDRAAAPRRRRSPSSSPSRRKRCALGQERAVLGDQQLPAEDEVGRRLVHAAVGVDVGGRRRAPTAPSPARGGTPPSPPARSRPTGRGCTVAPAIACALLGGTGAQQVLADLDRRA